MNESVLKVENSKSSMGTANSRRSESGRSGGCRNTGGVGRLSLRRLLLHSPLFGHRLQSATNRVIEGRYGLRRVRNTATPVTIPPRINSVRPSTASHLPGTDNISEEEDDVMECPLCLGMFDAENFPVLSTCSHRSCIVCLRRYLSIEIQESRVCIACPECSEPMHPNDIKQILDNEFIYEKYEDFMVRRVLAADPDTRWCPAPDCNFAVIAQGCASCPEIWCQAPLCGKAFCYHCKAAWHPNQTCDAARRQRAPPTTPVVPPPQPHHSPTESEHTGLVKPCPRCSVLIVKIEDGSCNHMVCCVCGSEFCWLCMKEISDLHYLSPSGCTFWGKAPWSRKKKLLWQLGTLAGAPLGIALLAGVAAPALLLGLPVWAGRRARARCRKMPPAKRRALVVAAVAAALLAAPAIATIAVGIGVPILLFYVYGVVPVSLCRSGGCGLSTSPRGGVRLDFNEYDDNPNRASDSGSIALAGGSSNGILDSKGKSGAGGSPSSGGARSTTPAHTGSIASQDRLHAAHRLEVTADVVSALRLSLSSEAASLSEPLPADDASTRALAGSIRDYKQNQSETVSYSAADDCASERVRFDDNVSIIGPSSNAEFLPDTLTDKNSICSSRSFRSLGKSSITEELSESLDKSSIGSGPRNVIFEENLDDITDIQESPNSLRSNSQSSLPGARRIIPKLTLKTNHKHFTSFEEDVTSKTPPDVVKFLERTDKAINLISKQNKSVSSNVTNVPDRVVISTSYMDIASVQSVNVETPDTPVNECDASKPIVLMRDNGCKFCERDVECGSELPKRPLSKVAMLRNIFFHGSSMIDENQTPIDLAKPCTSESCGILSVKSDNKDIATINNSSYAQSLEIKPCETEMNLLHGEDESTCKFVANETTNT